MEFVEHALGFQLHISRRIEDAFAVLPMRWIVERTFAGPGNYRRRSKDDEILPRRADDSIRIAMRRVMLNDSVYCLRRQLSHLYSDCGLEDDIRVAASRRHVA